MVPLVNLRFLSILRVTSSCIKPLLKNSTSSLHPEFSFLPRKFKIAVSAAENDRALLRSHDIALRLHHNDAGEAGFEVMAGGGQGRTPVLATTLREFLPQAGLSSYLEAVLRVYNPVP